MTDPERDRIMADAKADADLHNRLSNAEKDIKDMKAMQARGVAAIWAAAAYLATQVWAFITSGGVIK